MNLKDLLLAYGYSVYKVAAAAGTPPAHLYNLLHRVRNCRPPLGRAIERASGGVIRAAWLTGLEPVPEDLTPFLPVVPVHELHPVEIPKAS